MKVKILALKGLHPWTMDLSAENDLHFAYMNAHTFFWSLYLHTRTTLSTTQAILVLSLQLSVHNALNTFTSFIATMCAQHFYKHT